MWDVIVLIPDHCLSIYFGQDCVNKYNSGLALCQFLYYMEAAEVFLHRTVRFYFTFVITITHCR